jgi:integrase
MCNAPIYLKHKAIINLLYYGALRRGELLKLKIEHLSHDRKITIVGSKYGKSRVIPIPADLRELLIQYLTEFNPDEYLFNGDKGTGMYSAKSVENIIKNTAKLCGIEKRVYPHIMRSSRATHLLDNGASDMYVSEFLGHADIQTTRDYYCKLTIKGMQDNFDRVDDKLQKTVTNFNSREKLQLSVTK